jgi:hypothetical protein
MLSGTRTTQRLRSRFVSGFIEFFVFDILCTIARPLSESTVADEFPVLDIFCKPFPP